MRTLDPYPRLTDAVARAVPRDEVTGYSVDLDPGGRSLALTLRRGPDQGTASVPLGADAEDDPEWTALRLVDAALARLGRLPAAV